MKNRILVLSLLALVCDAHVKPQSDTGPPPEITDVGCIQVQLIEKTSISAPVLNQALLLASEMLIGVGVHVEWDTGSHSRKNSSVDRRIVVEMSGGTPWNYFEGALGISRPFDGVHVTVFYDRVEEIGLGSLKPILLAHVLVHELTHMLEGVDRHSNSGIMKAFWGPDEYYEMTSKPLAFTPEDILLIKNGFRR